MDDRIKETVNDNKDIAEKLQSIPMSNKKIEAWKVQVAKDKSIIVASGDCIRKLENQNIRYLLLVIERWKLIIYWCSAIVQMIRPNCKRNGTVWGQRWGKSG